jgi:hypothetical protein
MAALTWFQRKAAATHCPTSASSTGKWLSGRTGDDTAFGVELDAKTVRLAGVDNEDRRRHSWLPADGAAAWRLGRRVRLVASSLKRRMGEGENGGPARRVGEEEGGPGGRQDAWPVEAGGRAREMGVRTGENRGGGEAADRWSLVTVLAV